MDNLTVNQRSRLMRRVREKDTGPEMVVRRIAHRMGYRYQLHRADLPGKPDLVFVRRAKIIFVHGCFWHGHRCRRGQNRPASNIAYWSAKLDRNKARDRRNASQLRRQGWSILVLWECELGKSQRIEDRLARFLN